MDLLILSCVLEILVALGLWKGALRIQYFSIWEGYYSILTAGEDLHALVQAFKHWFCIKKKHPWLHCKTVKLAVTVQIGVNERCVNFMIDLSIPQDKWERCFIVHGRSPRHIVSIFLAYLLFHIGLSEMLLYCRYKYSEVNHMLCAMNTFIQFLNGHLWW